MSKSRYPSGSYELEDRDISDEMEVLQGNPNASQRLLDISGLRDWSKIGYEIVDNLSEITFIGLDKLQDYVMERYCSVSPEAIEWKYISMSLMLSLTIGEIRLYNLSRYYENEIRFLVNVYERLFKSSYRGNAIVSSRF